MILRFVIAVAILAQAANAYAGSYDPRADFYSDHILHDAVANIDRMPEAELRAFVRYLAECGDEQTNPVATHACAAASNSYEIEFEDKRALDKLIMARSSLALSPVTANANDPVALANAAAKIGIILATLEHAARARFRTLKSH